MVTFAGTTYTDLMFQGKCWAIKRYIWGKCQFKTQLLGMNVSLRLRLLTIHNDGKKTIKKGLQPLMPTCDDLMKDLKHRMKFIK